MRVSGLIGVVAALALVVLTVLMGGDGRLFLNPPSAVICVGLTLAIGVASFGLQDLLHAVAMVRVVVGMPGDVRVRDLEVIRGLIAPLYAAGMIGTLIGLVTLLMSLDDPSQIGGGMAVALLTVLYSLLGAELILRPASHRMADLLGESEVDANSGDAS